MTIPTPDLNLLRKDLGYVVTSGANGSTMAAQTAKIVPLGIMPRDLFLEKASLRFDGNVEGSGDYIFSLHAAPSGTPVADAAEVDLSTANISIEDGDEATTFDFTLTTTNSLRRLAAGTFLYVKFTAGTGDTIAATDHVTCTAFLRTPDEYEA